MQLDMAPGRISEQVEPHKVKKFRKTRIVAQSTTFTRTNPLSPRDSSLNGTSPLNLPDNKQFETVEPKFRKKRVVNLNTNAKSYNDPV